MRKSKIRKILVPSISLLALSTSFMGISFMNDYLSGYDPDVSYSKPILQEVTQSVISQQETNIVKPYVSENVVNEITYYEKDSDEKTQANSLIYYEKTYMPSTGILYTSDEDFDVISVYDGIVTNIKDDDILGTFVEITHNNNLTTYYYSVSNVKLVKNDEIKKGDIIGQATSNKISEKKSLFFEVYYQGKSMNPEGLYEKTIEELQ